MNYLFERKAGVSSIDNFDLLSNESGIFLSGDNLNRRTIYKKLLYSAIKTQLNEKQRIAIQLYYFDRLTIYEIADRTKITPSAVSKRLKNAKSKINNFAETCLNSGLFKNY